MFDYQLLACGKKIKQEKIGDFIIERPAYQATFKNRRPFLEPDLSYSKTDKWKEFSEKKIDNYHLEIDRDITILLKKSGKGQIGIFPEQYQNWLWLDEILKNEKRDLNIINCFGYTGISTLFAANNNSNGKNIHLDGSKSIVNWAKKNAKISNLDNNNIAWVVEDVLTYLRREVNRGSKFDGFILDPPAFGRGPKGKIWKFDKNIKELLKLVKKLISENPKFILISAHDQNSNSTDLKNLIADYLNIPKNQIEHGKLQIKSDKGNNLDSGYFARWQKK